ncbi:MAG: hypothetical protein WCF84_20245 [Anaerolineae bacterium]
MQRVARWWKGGSKGDGNPFRGAFVPGVSATSVTGLLPLTSSGGDDRQVAANKGGTASPSPFTGGGIFLLV